MHTYEYVTLQQYIYTHLQHAIHNTHAHVNCVLKMKARKHLSVYMFMFVHACVHTLKCMSVTVYMR